MMLIMQMDPFWRMAMLLIDTWDLANLLEVDTQQNPDIRGVTVDGRYPAPPGMYKPCK